MNLSSWLMYLTVVLLSSLSPGPAVLLSISNSIARGARAALYSCLGNVVGLFLLSATSMAGVGAVLKSSTTIFEVLKIFGAAYLVYLGMRQWRSNTNAFTVPQNPLFADTRTPGKLFTQGVLLALTNPKAILFFAALFPQFIIAERPLASQFVVLTGTLMVISFSALMGYALLASSAKSWLTVGYRARAFNRVSGSAFVLLGLGMLRLKNETN